MKQSWFLTSIFFCALFALQPIVSAQAGNLYQVESAPSTAQQEAAQIDQLLKEGRALLAKGTFEEIFPKAEQALALSIKINDKTRQSRSLMQIATASFHTGLTGKAIAYFKQSALLANQTKDSNLESLALNSAAVLLISSGFYEEALHFYTQSLALRRQLNDRRGEAYILMSMSPLYMDTGDFVKADQLLQDALRIIREVKAGGAEVKGLEEFTLLRIAWVEYLRGNFAVALNVVQETLAKETEQTSGANKVEVRHRLGELHTVMGNHEKAAEIYTELVELARKLKIQKSEALAFGNLAWSVFQLGKATEALALIKQAIPLLRQTGSTIDDWKFLYYLAEIEKALGHNEAALSSYREAIGAIERVRSQTVPTETARAGLGSSLHDAFVSAIDFLFSLNREAEALEIAEAYHARAFLDVLAESKIDLRTQLSQEHRKREDQIFESIASIQKELWKPDLTREREKRLKEDLQRAESELETFQLEMRRINPRYASVKYSQPVKPEFIAKELLDSDSALIEYVLGEKRSFAWVVHKDKITAVILPPKKEIDDLVKEYREALTEKVSALTMGQATAKLHAKGQLLYEKLFRPLDRHLSSAQKLIIVADGALTYLPFETLVRNPKDAAKTSASPLYLIERFAISYAPSASALAAIRAIEKETAKAAKGVMAFGDPVYTNSQPSGKDANSANLNSTNQAERGFDYRQLPYTRTEVNEIVSLFPSLERTVYLGTEAREQKVKTESLDRYRYLHFAAHAMIDEDRPKRSGVVLSSESNSKEDGTLQMSEVMRLKLNADLVTLSACRTGLGKLLTGEGVIGLTRAFLYAGASSVVVSLWNVNDMATATLMKAFYGNLKKGLSKDEALRQAKLELIRGQKRVWRQPYYWAPFVLIGERQ
jgi:CHAT domain-containing protein